MEKYCTTAENSQQKSRKQQQTNISPYCKDLTTTSRELC
jgi:hypothetical protein